MVSAGVIAMTAFKTAPRHKRCGAGKIAPEYPDSSLMGYGIHVWPQEIGYGGSDNA